LLALGRVATLDYVDGDSDFAVSIDNNGFRIHPEQIAVAVSKHSQMKLGLCLSSLATKIRKHRQRKYSYHLFHRLNRAPSTRRCK